MDLNKEFQSSLAKSIRLRELGDTLRWQLPAPLRWHVDTPFRHRDGDGLIIVLQQMHDGSLVLSDECHTCLHLSVEWDNWHGSKGFNEAWDREVYRIQEQFEIEQSKEGELWLLVEAGNFGETLCDFAQGLIQLADSLDPVRQAR